MVDRKKLNLVAVALLEALPPEGMGEGPLVVVIEASKVCSWEEAREAVSFWVEARLLRRSPGYLIERGPLWDTLHRSYCRFLEKGPGFVAREA